MESREATLARFSRRLEDRVQSFALPNGLRFAVYHRPDTPIISFRIIANVRMRPGFDEAPRHMWHSAALL